MSTTNAQDITDGQKPCSRCEDNLPLTEFYRQARQRSGYSSYCKSCDLEYNRIRRYGLNNEGFDALTEKQDEACACCKTPLSECGRIVVDHCHNTGEVRGILCQRCNVGIGNLGDTLEGVMKALHYLQSNREK